MAFVRILANMGRTLTHSDGLFSQTPGFYLSKKGRVDVPRGLPTVVGTYHYIPGSYMYHLGRWSVCIVSLPLSVTLAFAFVESLTLLTMFYGAMPCRVVS